MLFFTYTFGGGRCGKGIYPFRRGRCSGSGLRRGMLGTEYGVGTADNGTDGQSGDLCELNGRGGEEKDPHRLKRSAG